MNGTINELKQGLLKCAVENEDRTYLTGQIIISSICKDAKKTIEELEQESEEWRLRYLKATDEGTSWAHLKSLEYKNRELKEENEQLKAKLENTEIKIREISQKCYEVESIESIISDLDNLSMECEE